MLLPLLTSCGQRTESAITSFCASRGGVRGVVNGVVETLPAIVPLTTSGGGGCTGNVLSDTTVLTAAHCVGTGQISYLGIYSSQVSYSKNGLDLAVAVFPPGTFGQDWTRILTRAPVYGETIAVVGYGETVLNAGGADGQNRIGCNTVRGFANVSGQTIQMTQNAGNYLFYLSPINLADYGAPGMQSMSGHGDSGGGIFIEGRLAAVTNFGDKRSVLRTRWNIVGDPYQGQSGDALYEYDTNLFSTTAVAVLRQAQTRYGANIPDLDALAAAVGGGSYSPYSQQPYYQQPAFY